MNVGSYGKTHDIAEIQGSQFSTTCTFKSTSATYKYDPHRNKSAAKHSESESLNNIT